MTCLAIVLLQMFKTCIHAIVYASIIHKDTLHTKMLDLTIQCEFYQHFFKKLFKNDLEIRVASLSIRIVSAAAHI